MVMSPYEWKILEWDEKPKTYKQNKKWCGVDWLRCYMYFFSQFTGVMKEIVDNESTPFELSVMCEYARALFRNE